MVIHTYAYCQRPGFLPTMKYPSYRDIYCFGKQHFSLSFVSDVAGLRKVFHAKQKFIKVLSPKKIWVKFLQKRNEISSNELSKYLVHCCKKKLLSSEYKRVFAAPRRGSEPNRLELTERIYSFSRDEEDNGLTERFEMREYVQQGKMHIFFFFF